MILYQDFEEEEKQLLDTKLAAKSQFYTRTQETDIVNIFSEP